MKNVFIQLLLIVAIMSSCVETKEQSGPNLVPESSATAPNYWCTWYAQNYWQQRGGEIADFKKINNPNAREELSYDHLFNSKDGWVVNFLPKGRSDYYFLIDHGWQTKEKSERLAGASPFFSLQLDPRDFPEYANARPEEQLRLFNEEIQSHGWRGLGIWMRGELTPELAEIFVEWSKYAGINYWKIDGGDIVDFDSYKAKMRIFPELQLEYVTPAGNMNPNWDKAGQLSYPSIYKTDSTHRANTLRVLQNSDIFRTYDASPQLMSATTLRRTHDILKATAGDTSYISVLNLQDDCNAAAALGCLVASKRHPNFNERLLDGKDLHHQLNGKRHMQHRMNEAERFGRWSRIAPAFASGIGTYVSSEKELIDCFPYDKHSTWNKMTYGKTVYQSAPAIMARNMALPKVEIIGDAPYVMATTYPNGAVCVATEGRVKPEDEWCYPLAKVTIQVADLTQPIGIFGYYDELIIEFAQNLDAVKSVYAQDLLADCSKDIKSQITFEGNRLIISGDLIKEIGCSSADKGDVSVPGMVLMLNK